MAKLLAFAVMYECVCAVQVCLCESTSLPEGMRVLSCVREHVAAAPWWPPTAEAGSRAAAVWSLVSPAS